MIIESISDEEFNLFRKMIYQEAGINLTDMKRALLQARITRRCRELSINSFRAYYDYLRDNYESEKFHFINAITTNKTEFFREKRHFEFMNEVVLPEFENSGRRELKIWSSACSTGEEPYTIAITLMEYFKNRKKPDIKILATDIDTNVLETARNGVYRKELLGDVEGDLLKRYFYRGTGDKEGTFKVKESLSELIHFRRLNLMDSSYPMKGTFAVIFCRNVIIYFDKETQKRVFKTMHRYLDEDGYLFLGHSENITSITRDYRIIGSTIYSKAPAGA